MSAPPTLDTLSDRELVTRYVRRRDEPAFAALVRRHSPLVLGVCQRVLGHRQDVEDAFQATFLVLARDAHCVKKRDSLSSWLHGVAYRTSLRAAESRHRRIRLLKDVTMIEDSSLADVADRHERQLLDEELQSLPEKYRAPLVLHYLESKTAKQVAGELKLTVSTVEGRLKRGRKELQLRLARRGVGLSVALAALPLTPSLVTAAELESLVAGTIHAGLSYTAGDPAGPLYTHEAARLAAQETLAMTATTTTATLTALLLVPVALAISNHGEGIPTNDSHSPIATTVDQSFAQPITLTGAEIGESKDDGVDLSKRHKGEEFSEEEGRIAEALNKTGGFGFINASLAEVLSRIASDNSIHIVIDDEALRQAGVDINTPITISTEAIPLRSFLNLILKPRRLGYLIEDDVLKITSNVTIKRDIEELSPDATDSTVTEKHGFGDLVFDGRALQAAGRVRPDGPRVPLHFKEYPETVARIAGALEQETSLEFVDTPLSEAIQFISNVYNVTILIDKPELNDIGIPTDEPVNLIISGVKLESALNLMLPPLTLDYLIRDEVLMITSTEKTEQTLETRVYDLRRLAMPPGRGDPIGLIIRDSIPGAVWKPSVGKSIESTIKVPNQPDVGGTIHMIDGGIVVTQTQRVHRQIVELLQQLNRHAEADE